MLVASVGRDEAEDCFQETFIAALRAYPRLRAGRREHNLRAWVLTIAQNKAMDAHRSRKRRALPVADPDTGAAPGQDGGPGPGGALWRAGQELPGRQRPAGGRRFLGGPSPRGVAAAR